MSSKDIFDEDWTPKKIAGLIICLAVLFIIGHYQYCHWKNGFKYTPRSCNVVTKIVNFATGMK